MVRTRSHARVHTHMTSFILYRIILSGSEGGSQADENGLKREMQPTRAAQVYLRTQRTEITAERG